jgi:hypothetical protein
MIFRGIVGMRFGRSRGFGTLTIALLALIGSILPAASSAHANPAQEMQHEHATGDHVVACNVCGLTVASSEKTITLQLDQFKALPHKAITVHNGHTNADETYSGVLLSDLLTQVAAPLGTKLHGKALASYILATGSDGYQAIYSIAEVDPYFHTGDVIVADTINGRPLEDGPFKLVNTEDKHPARWVRNLASIKLVAP